MDIASAEIARLRAERAARAAAASSSGGKKYARRGDLQREASAAPVDGENDGADADADGAGRVTGAKRAREDDGKAIAATAAVVTRVLEDEEADAALDALTNDEAVARLRTLGQPATMFGETREDRIFRLKVATKNFAIVDETTTTATQVNEKLLDAEHVEAFARKKKEQSLKAKERSLKGVAGDGGAEVVDDDEPEVVEEKALMDSFAKAAAKIKKQRAAEDAEPIDQVAVYLKMLVSEWEAEIDAKSEAWCYTTEGRQTISTFQTTKQHLKPLFKRIKRRLLPGDLERALYLIMQAMKQRNYKKAMDAYVGIAIGNAAWPIGVTMVGIHARSAREKIGAQSQAHAMHDEETRKFLQSIKRLMTYAQESLPDHAVFVFEL
jgi:pre-mRNA-splicing factor 18